jgi:predicted Fe-Mo cluster-binding NifX family protein
MNIAITSQDKTLQGALDSRFGRTRYFIIYNIETKEFAAIENIQNLNAAQGAGIQTAQNVVATDSKAVITSNCGPKAYRVLSAAGVKIYKGIEASVEENIKKYNNGELEEMEDANVAGHWM